MAEIPDVALFFDYFGHMTLAHPNFFSQPAFGTRPLFLRGSGSDRGVSFSFNFFADHFLAFFASGILHHTA